MKIVSAEEYSKITGLGVAEVKRQCKLGNLKCYMTEGGHYKIEYYEDDNSRVESLLRENERLKNKLLYVQKILIET